MSNNHHFPFTLQIWPIEMSSFCALSRGRVSTGTLGAPGLLKISANQIAHSGASVWIEFGLL